MAGRGAEWTMARPLRVTNLPQRSRVLRRMSRNSGKVLDRDTIFNECWGMDYMPNSRSLDQHISQLRKKIERDPGNPRIIKTVHNAGYRHEQC